MPVTPGYRPFIVDTIIDFMKSSFGDTFKAYYFGDPIDIPADDMPCLVVSKKSGQVGFGPTGMDENTETILIQVIYNKKDQLGNPANEFTSHRQLMECVEGRHATTGHYLDTSIMGVLRKNATLGSVVVNQVVAPEYGTAMRGEITFTEEALIKLTVTELIPVSNRS